MLNKGLQQWFALLTDSHATFSTIIDNQHQYVMVNHSFAQLIGLSSREIIGLKDSDTLGDDFYQQIKPYYLQGFSGKSLTFDIIPTNPCVITEYWRITVSPLTLDDDKIGPSHLLVNLENISESYLLQRSLDNVEQKFSALSQLVSQGVLVVESEQILTANPQAVELLGYSNQSELLGEHFSRLFSTNGASLNDTPLLAQHLTTQPITRSLLQPSGKKIELQLTAQPIQMLGQQAQLVVIHAANQQAEYHVAHHSHSSSSLEGVYHRSAFLQRLDDLIVQQTPLFMLYLDIDNFKNINDSLGHNIGDNVIQEVALRLKQHLPTSCIVGHLGGDEFAFIYPYPQTEDNISAFAEKIIKLVNQPFDLHHFSKRLACSIGSVVYPGDGNNARLLLQNADTAMYEAKQQGRNRLVQFNHHMNKEARMRLWLEIELQKALQNNGLEVWYQPKVNAKDFNINGAEALVRWKHPIEGYISPGAFIPVAEKSGLIEQLGRYVIREVFKTVKRWHQLNLLPGNVAINISAEQFANPQLLNFLTQLLRQIQLNPKLITFELTESAIMNGNEHTLRMLNDIKKLGFSLSIDDFGTGYSSLAYLAKFPIDELKIDRSFVCDLESLPKQVTVIESIIKLGQSLNLSVVAEGVETQQQARLLSHLNCHTIQGFHFYRPQPKEEIEALFSKHRRVERY